VYNYSLIFFFSGANTSSF